MGTPQSPSRPARFHRMPSKCTMRAFTGRRPPRARHSPHRYSRPAGPRPQLSKLAHRSAAAHAHEQPRSRRSPSGRMTSWSTAASARPRATGTATTASSTRLRALEADETLLIQSGKPVGVFRTHADAPRVLIANSNLVRALGGLGAFQRARSQGPDDVRPDDGRQLDLHRQPGHRAGHLRDVRRDGPPAFRRQARGQVDSHRGARRHGRRAAARGDDGRRLDARRRMPARAHRQAPARPAISMSPCDTLDEALEALERARSEGKADLGRPARQCLRSAARSSCGAACGRTS